MWITHSNSVLVVDLQVWFMLESMWAFWPSLECQYLDHSQQLSICNGLTNGLSHEYFFHQPIANTHTNLWDICFMPTVLYWAFSIVRVIEMSSCCEIHTVIHFLNATKVWSCEIDHQIHEVYGDNAISDTMIRSLIRMFNEGQKKVHSEAFFHFKTNA